MGLQAFLLFLAVLAGVSDTTDGSHFRGGIISWRPDESGSFKVAFTFRLAFRRTFSGYYCNQNTVNSNGIIGSGGYWIAQCVGSYYCSSLTTGSVRYRCTDFSSIEDWSQGENSFNYTFPHAGPWRIRYSSCCWISLNLGGGSWYLSSTVNLTRRSDTGKINSSPVSASSPIVRLQQNCQKIVTIPTEDADGDKVRCRWANISAECGGVCKMFKYGTLDEEHCSITYEGTGATGWYAVAIMLEDYSQSTTDFNAVSPFSSIGLQFLVDIISYSGSCYRKPYFTGSTPAADSCIELNIGSTYRASIAVKHIDSARRVIEINVVAPTGVKTTALNSTTDQYGETVYSRSLEWTPFSSQRDQNIICFTAVDNFRIESDKRCITILVTGLNRASPMAILSSRYPSSVVYNNWYYYYYNYYYYTSWGITFDRPIKKPKNPSFIRIVINGTVIFKLDTSSSPEVTVGGNNNTVLNFRIRRYVLSMTGTYSIILDPGSVVGIGCSSDGPPTSGVNAPDLWRVYVYGYCSTGYYWRSGWGCADVNECVNPSFRYRRSLLVDTFKEPGTRSGRQKRYIYNYLSPSPTMSIMSASSSIQASISYSLGNECHAYNTLQDPTRSVFYSLSYFYCDNGLFRGWYRFDGVGGNQIPETCPPQYSCGTVVPGWLNGTHPSVYQGIVNRTICYNWYGGCCTLKNNILVRNCGNFYVYWLERPPGCNFRYCTDPGNSSSSQVLSSLQPTPTQQIPAPSSSAVGQGYLGCYQLFTSESGNIYSPNYPMNYGRNQNCLWNITLPYGRVNLRFYNFSVESCPWDYLDVIDGWSLNHQRIGRYCGNIRPPPSLYSSGRHLILHFRSDYIIHLSGFHIFYSNVSSNASECHVYNNLTDPTRSVFYKTYVGCDSGLSQGWYRFDGVGGNQIPETCPPRYSCGTNAPGWLNGKHPSIYQGIVNRTVCYHWYQSCCQWTNNVLVRNCGNFYVYWLERLPWCSMRYCTNPASECYTYTTLSDTTRSIFYRSNVVCDSGLTQGWYRFDGVGGNQIPEICPPKYSCGTHAPGWLTDKHPSVYQGIVNRTICYHWSQSCCLWKNNILVRNCGNFYVYRLERPPVCHLRYCTIPGNSSSQVLLSLQPTPTPTQRTPAPSSSVVGQGYRGCYQHFISYSGYIDSPNYPWLYGHNQDCVWNITLSYGYVRLHFYTFTVESCPHDYLDVIDGWSLNHQRIGRYCGPTRRPPTYLYSSGRHLILHFRSDHSVHYSGFRIYYSTVYSVPSSSMYVNSLSTQMSINPTSVQASRPSSSAINTPFVLHLPANCQHSCVNTVGSFYCRCYEGYTLNADGKTCSDIDECQKNNGGCSHHCVNFPGSFYCSCLEGQTISSDNKTCTEPGIEVTCGEEFMQVDLDRANFRNFDPAYLHLNYQLCRATANSSHISLRTTLNGCGTTFNETNDEIRFDNVVKAEKVVVQGVVTRSFDVNIKFYCKYSKSKLVQVSFRPFGTVTGSEGGFGNFTFKMVLFKSSAYRYPYTAADYPISVQLNQLLYIQYSVESFQSNLVAFADTCRATTSRDPYSSPQYVFLRNGCPEDSTISFNYSPGPVQQLSMRAFDFLADYPIVYLHCQVLACHRQTAGSRCSKGCQRSIRKKRELANQETETEQQKETETYNINSGAIKVFRISKESSDTDKLQTTLVSSVSSVGGVLLIVVIVLAVIIIKKGFIKKLSRRNKVDDIYGREQQTRTNAYVNDASAEGEGDATQGRELETRDEGFLVREDIFLDGNYRTESGC